MRQQQKDKPKPSCFFYLTQAQLALLATGVQTKYRQPNFQHHPTLMQETIAFIAPGPLRQGSRTARTPRTPCANAASHPVTEKAAFGLAPMLPVAGSTGMDGARHTVPGNVVVRVWTRTLRQ